MGRHDLSFLLCCCKAFLGDPQDDSVYVNPTIYSEVVSDNNKTPSGRPWDKVRLRRKKVKREELYGVLGVLRHCDTEEIRAAYKSRCIEMHPDKFAQRGLVMNDVEREQFQRIKEAYEVLSDPRRRETYDAIGEKGMRWLEDPFSLDPKELVENFISSEFFDRLKIFFIVIVVASIILSPPIIVCLRAEHKIGGSWALIFIPLWIVNVVAVLYHAKTLMVATDMDFEDASREGIDWVDPKVPIVVRVVAALKYGLLLFFQLLVVLKLDGAISMAWSRVFAPVFVWEALFLYKKLPPSRTKIVTKTDLETALGKPFSEFSGAEKEMISRRYIVVPTIESVEFIIACRTKARAKTEVYKSAFRILFFIALIYELDGRIQWSWWLVFLPFWVASLFLCCLHGEHFIVAQATAAEILGNDAVPDWNNTSVDAEQGRPKVQKKPLSENEKEVVMNEMTQVGYRTFSFCIGQIFLILIVCILLGKLQGAEYSSVWILSPVLIVVGLILLCMGVLMFGIREVMIQPDELNDSTDYNEMCEKNLPDYNPPPPRDPEKVLPSKSSAAGRKELHDEVAMIWGNMSLSSSSPKRTNQSIEIAAQNSGTVILTPTQQEDSFDIKKSFSGRSGIGYGDDLD